MYSFCRILCENHVFGCENIVLSGVTCTNASDLALRLTVHMLQMILLYCISMPLTHTHTHTHLTALFPGLPR